MPSVPVDVSRLLIPDAEQVCAWLIENAGLKTADLERAQRLQQESEGTELLGLLTRLGLVSEFELARAWAALLQAPLLLADAVPPLLDPLPPLTERFMRHYQVVPVGWSDQGLQVLSANPGTLYPFQAIAYACEVPVRLSIGPRNEVETLIERYYGQGRSAMGTLIENLDEEGGSLEDIEHLKDLASEAPVIRLVNLILQRAVEQRASDIHIEPFESQLKVRYRIDGVLHEAEAPPSSSSAAVISRVKIMARLDIAERRLPQDGRIMLRIQGKELDLRVSTVPTSFGESVVMRLLDRQTINFDFPSLGFDGERLDEFLDVLERPHGILLVTGPTGSGKTTTLYTTLKKLATSEVNLCTIEDPIEMVEPAFNQMQVQHNIDLSFAAGVRALMRQDPDIIMIGEIRDLETAEMAIQAALTGHLVLSTLHTNDAPSAISRMLELGVPHYLLKATILGVMAQRLVRTLCPHCKAPINLNETDWQTLTRPWQAPVPPGAHQAVGCVECRDTGYRGRAGVYEIMVMSDNIKALISADLDLTAMRRQAFKEGTRSLRLSGAQKVSAGLTTLEEVLRVTPQSEQR
ncbi:GspE/PulE family protein [Pseudomonas syringae]|uniref:GspE/PulE family protein n=1 Tax=Pseudomonas syringae TaxID=317 RepID=UPI0016052A09|nr:GspE/PulE family protein [Pseudomonas syringae]